METLATGDTLKKGDLLNWYRIESILGHGGFGVTYLATDTNLQKPVAIKEYLPNQIASRGSNNSLRPSSPDSAQTFQWGLDRFIQEAQTLAKFTHRNIVRVLSVFQANDTAYIVMEYEGGSVLRHYLNQNSANSEENLKTLFQDLLDGLRSVHEHGFIHRDIKPANIIIRKNGSPVLIDFGSARKSHEFQTSTLTSLVSVGYAPLEQYSTSSDNKQGPWTDIYACGAVLYYAILGKPPVDATQRGTSVLNNSPDPFVPLTQLSPPGYSREFLSAIDWALNFKVSARPQTVVDWTQELFRPSIERLDIDQTQIDDRTRIMPREVKTGATATASYAHATSENNKPAESALELWETDNIREDVAKRPSESLQRREDKRNRLNFRIFMFPLGLIVAGFLAYFTILKPANKADVSSIVSGENDISAESVVVANPVATDTKITMLNPSSESITDVPVASVSATDSETASSPKVDSLLNSVVVAIQQIDEKALRNLVHISPRNVDLFSALFRQFSLIELTAITSESGHRGISISRMVRSDGISAVPAPSYRVLLMSPPIAGSTDPKWTL